MGTIHNYTMQLAIFHFIFLIATLNGSPSCPVGWFDGHPYELGCVLFNADTALIWDDAQEFCHTQDESNLVEIFTPYQQDFLEQMALQIETFTQTPRNWLI